MKKAEIIEKLSELTKVDVDKLTTALTSTEDNVEFEFPKIHTFSDEELNARDLQNARAGNATVIKQVIRDYRDKMKKEFPDEFDFEDRTMDNLIGAALKAGEKKANVKPNEKVQELEKLVSGLRKNLETIESEKNAAIKEKEKTLFDYRVDSTLTKKVPFMEDSSITATEYVALFKMNHVPAESDGIITYLENGEVAKDPKTLKPVPIDQKFETWLTEKGVRPGNGEGRGECDRNKARSFQSGTVDSIQTTEDFDKYCDAQKIPKNDFTRRSALIREVQKKNTSFKYGQS